MSRVFSLEARRRRAAYIELRRKALSAQQLFVIKAFNEAIDAISEELRRLEAGELPELEELVQREAALRDHAARFGAPIDLEEVRAAFAWRAAGGG